MTVIYRTQWHGMAAWTLENDRISVVILPGMGAKIVSLFDKLAGYEWLVGPVRPMKPVEYGASFTDQDLSGWDEMFPTINACKYPDTGEFGGRTLPDHGEVWSLSWAVESPPSDSLKLRVGGVALPYSLTRSASLVEPATLQLDYELVNKSRIPFYFLWAAHPQFSADDSTRIQLPESVDRVVNVMDDPSLGPLEGVLPWPKTKTKDGSLFHLDRVGPVTNRTCRKFYLPPESPVTSAGLLNRRHGCALRLEWPPEMIPYLGIWVDEGTYNTAPTAALEPATGYYDSLTLAAENGRVSSLPAAGQLHWSLQVHLQQLENRTGFLPGSQRS